MNHLLNITTQALDVGATTPFLWMFEEREKMMEFYEHASGSRMHANYIRPGGVASDIDDKLIASISECFDALPPKLDDMESLLTENRIFKQRLVNIGIMTREQALEWGFTGPMLRASGVAWDLRKDQPYEIYDQIEFGIPIGKVGDCYDRYLVRVAEIRESIKIIKQCIEKMPQGPIKTDDPHIATPERSEMKESMEEMINHFKLFTEG